MEQRKRTLAKTLTWRIIAVLVTMITVWGFGATVGESLVISLVANFIKAFLYYMHERVWNQVHFGRELPPEYSI